MTGAASGMLYVWWHEDTSATWKHWLVMCFGAATASFSLLHHLYTSALVFYFTVRGTEAVSKEIVTVAHMHKNKPIDSQFNILKTIEAKVMGVIQP